MCRCWCKWDLSLGRACHWPVGSRLFTLGVVACSLWQCVADPAPVSSQAPQAYTSNKLEITYREVFDGLLQSGASPSFLLGLSYQEAFVEAYLIALLKVKCESRICKVVEKACHVSS